MKRLLRSFVIIVATLALVSGSTLAYFTSSIIAANNTITTGTLMLAIDSTQQHTTRTASWGYPNAYTVVEDVDGISNQSYTFEPWVNAQPGTYEDPWTDSWDRPAGNFSVWLAVRNKGSLPLLARAYANGDWLTLPRITSDPDECGGMTPNPYLVKVRNIHRYAATPTTGCENHIPCQSLRDSLETGPWDPQTVTATDVAGDPVTGYIGGDVTIDAGKYVIYRVDLQLDPSTDNCYQGATYSYNLNAEAIQAEGGATFSP